MKKLITLFLTLYASIAYAQELPFDEIASKVTYTEVVTVPGQTKKQLFEKAKKWIATKNSEQTPYTIVVSSEQEGSIAAKGVFALPVDRRKYTVPFVIDISCKDGKCKYMFTDITIQFRTQAGLSGGGFSYWSGSSYHEAETLEYPIETFYPSRLHGKKPVIKWYEEIRKGAFRDIDKELRSISSSLKQALTTQQNW